MLTTKTVKSFLDELASKSPAPGGGSVAALAGAMGSALISMVCNLTIGKKKYANGEAEIKSTLERSEELRKQFTLLVDKDTEAFNKVMEAYSLPKDSDDQKALRSSAIQASTKDATLVPLEVMKHVIDGLALTRVVAEKGNDNSISDTGVSALMFYGALEGAALNVKINLGSIKDSEFVGWKSDELTSLLHTATMMRDEILTTVKEKMGR
jgi:formiminotetrahydrofolate cyclodeaminase